MFVRVHARVMPMSPGVHRIPVGGKLDLLEYLIGQPEEAAEGTGGSDSSYRPPYFVLRVWLVGHVTVIQWTATYLSGTGDGGIAGCMEHSPGRAHGCYGCPRCVPFATSHATACSPLACHRNSVPGKRAFEPRVEAASARPVRDRRWHIRALVAFRGDARGAHVYYGRCDLQMRSVRCWLSTVNCTYLATVHVQ